MENSKVKKLVSYSVVEQPGDGTRYSHIVVFYGSNIAVYRDVLSGGAGLLKPLKMYGIEHMVRRQIKGMDATEGAAFVRDNLPLNGENSYTVASALRAVTRALED